MAQKLADEAANEQKRLDTMKGLMKAILADLDAFDKHGAKSPHVLAEQQTRLTENMEKFRQQWMGGQEGRCGRPAGLRPASTPCGNGHGRGRLAGGSQKLWAAPETFAKFARTSKRASVPCALMVEGVTGVQPAAGGSDQGDVGTKRRSATTRRSCSGPSRSSTNSAR